MNEKDFENEFVDLARRNYPNRVFIQSFEMPYDEKIPKGVHEMPRYIADVLEIDELGQFHVWEHKLYNSREIWAGQVIGQLICYDFVFSTTQAMDGGIQSMRDRILNYANRQGYQENNPVLKFDTFEEYANWQETVSAGLGAVSKIKTALPANLFAEVPEDIPWLNQ